MKEKNLSLIYVDTTKIAGKFSMRIFILLIFIALSSGCLSTSDDQTENTLYVPSNEA